MDKTAFFFEHVTLPDREEMLQRLLKVEDSEDFRKYFYPSLLEWSGREVSIPVVVFAIESSIRLYRHLHGLSHKVVSQMDFHIYQIIDALIEDQEVAQAAKEFRGRIALTEAEATE